MICEYGSCGKDEWLICQCNNSSGVVLREKVHVVIFNSKHAVEPKEASISQKPAYENPPIFSLICSKRRVFFLVCHICSHLDGRVWHCKMRICVSNTEKLGKHIYRQKARKFEPTEGAKSRLGKEITRKKRLHSGEE